jgi:hypothetical protein
MRSRISTRSSKVRRCTRHATEPTTLAAALSDSPAGLDRREDHRMGSARHGGTPAFDRELRLATRTLYWTTNLAVGGHFPAIAEPEILVGTLRETLSARPI